MKICNTNTVFLILGFIFCALFLNAQEYVDIPETKSFVTDLTGTLTASDQEYLENKLRQFEEAKGSQLVVFILPTTKPEEIEQYSIRVAEKWEIGRGKIDDGVLLLVAKDDRKLRIEVGYGLEGAIPDIYAKRIIENIIVPQFRNGHFSVGINKGVDAIIDLINGEELPAVTKTSKSVSDHGRRFGIFGLIIFFVILSIVGQLVKKSGWKFGIAVVVAILAALVVSSIVMGVISLVVALIALFSKSGRGGGGGGYYGGGFYGGGSSYGSSGGGFGGFSGGGGSFGGGGASGGW